LADATLDRLVHNAHKLELKGESMQKKTKPLEPQTQLRYIMQRFASLRSELNTRSLSAGTSDLFPSDYPIRFIGMRTPSGYSVEQGVERFQSRSESGQDSGGDAGREGLVAKSSKVLRQRIDPVRHRRENLDGTRPPFICQFDDGRVRQRRTETAA
jgi:hypothetical protein